MKRLKFDNVSFRYPYDDYDAVSGLCFEVEEGETLSLRLGPQGGKTTVAKLVMGLIETKAGEIYGDGVPLRDVPVKDRNLAYFCQPALLYNATVYENISHGLILRGFGKTDIEEAVKEALKRFGLTDVADLNARKLPAEKGLRIALARASVRKAEFFILDGLRDGDAVKKIEAEASRFGASSLVLCDDTDITAGRFLDLGPLANLSEENIK